MTTTNDLIERIAEATGRHVIDPDQNNRAQDAIPGTAISSERLRDAIDWNEPVHTRAACGLRRGWLLPGMGSRLGGRRCGACCAALGILPGWGTPANEGLGEPAPQVQEATR